MNEQSQGRPNPTEERAKFAGDATGDIGGSAGASVPPDSLNMDASPSTRHDNPGRADQHLEDTGYEGEEAGSMLAHEREGLPTEAMPHRVPDTAGETRKKAPDLGGENASGRTS